VLLGYQASSAKNKCRVVTSSHMKDRGDMSKPELPFYTSAIFYGIATIIGPPSAHAQPPPPGGYQQSCRDSHIQGSTLVSSCKDRGQTFRPTELRDLRNVSATSSTTTAHCAVIEGRCRPRAAMPGAANRRSSMVRTFAATAAIAAVGWRRPPCSTTAGVLATYPMTMERCAAAAAACRPPVATRHPADRHSWMAKR
jgi:hypothetical protein